ncbi:hypothetical protein GCM10009858_10450 [Terrabacter carboxydivorans]|uniref:Uncharacterized protein n=1 Tax=Terrabacter carboxydivorans TaxID=619730 RepID=A0ABN3KZ85_9MICO
MPLRRRRSPDARAAPAAKAPRAGRADAPDCVFAGSGVDWCADWCVDPADVAEAVEAPDALVAASTEATVRFEAGFFLASALADAFLAAALPERFLSAGFLSAAVFAAALAAGFPAAGFRAADVPVEDVPVDDFLVEDVPVDDFLVEDLAAALAEGFAAEGVEAGVLPDVSAAALLGSAVTAGSCRRLGRAPRQCRPRRR